MEEALRQSEENYRALFDNSVIAKIVLDTETIRVVMANQAAVNMFGFSSVEEIRGAEPLAFIHSEDREEVLQIVGKNLAKQDSRQTSDLRAFTKDGREICLSATAARIMHEGRLAALISFADITERKLQNERLMITDRLASVGELAAGAAHELNNPLASIIGLSELLMEKNTPDYIRRDLAMIRDEARRAANVTSNLLTFARKHKPTKQSTQIHVIIEEVLRLRGYAHRSNCIEVERHLAPDLPEIPVDPFQIQQVFLNIVINAEYFMIQAHNRGTLTITTKRQKGSVAVSFTDDGTGIPPGNLRRIFNPFFTTKEAGKGTGLGLSICHGIVTAHGGQISARSQLGKETTICIELPINGRNDAEATP
jgi:two-component system NtrC family sensor kinase